MKYNVTTYTDDLTEITIMVSCRHDANMKTLFQKCAEEMHHELCRRGLVPDRIRFGYDLPNIWRNGAIGSLWFEDPFYNISITQMSNNCSIAI